VCTAGCTRPNSAIRQRFRRQADRNAPVGQAFNHPLRLKALADLALRQQRRKPIAEPDRRASLAAGNRNAQSGQRTTIAVDHPAGAVAGRVDGAYPRQQVWTGKRAVPQRSEQGVKAREVLG
jgi:hypothetical protein